MRVQLAGFVAEFAGNESNLIIGEPVVAFEGKFWVAPRPEWTHGDLRPVKRAEYDYVHWLNDLSRVWVTEGDFVWVAGRNFHVDLDDDLLVDVKRSIESWNQYQRGTYWTTGSRSSFVQFQRKISNLIEDALGRLLPDKMEREQATPDRFFRIYRNLSLPSSLDRYVWQAVYFFEMGRLRDASIVARLAVREGFLESVQAFDVVVKEKRDWIMAERLQSLSGVPSSAGMEERDLRLQAPRYRQIADAYENARHNSALAERGLAGTDR